MYEYRNYEEEILVRGKSETTSYKYVIRSF